MCISIGAIVRMIVRTILNITAWKKEVLTMYNELIDALRICASSGSCEACPNNVDGKCKSNGVFGGWDGQFNDAADAIERLVAEIDRKDKAIQGLLNVVDKKNVKIDLWKRAWRTAYKLYESVKESKGEQDGERAEQDPEQDAE